MSRRGVIAAIGVSAVAAGIVVALALNPSGNGESDASTPGPVQTATVRRVDLAATDLVDGTLGYGPLPPVICQEQGTYTWLPSEGSVINRGEPLFAVDNYLTVLFVGDVPAWRSLSIGVADGPDVRELEENLVALGYDPEQTITVDDHFSPATAAAVQRWQTAQGVPATGTVEPTDIGFEPAPVRVGTRTHEVGEHAESGDQPYAANSSHRVVTVALDASRQPGISPGLPVTINLLDGRTTPGTVTSVGKVAAPPATNATGSNQPTGPTVTLLVVPNDPNAVGDLDQLPVQLQLVTASRHAVLAVPITALLALPGGRDCLETVDASGHHHLVPVTPGLFAQTLVEIQTNRVVEGTKVVVAQ